AVLVSQVEFRGLNRMDLAEIVVDTGNLQPVTLGVDHSPPGQIVDGRTPQHCLLTAGVHGNVASYTRGFRRGGIDGKYQLGALGSIPDTLGDDAGARQDGRHGPQFAWELDAFHIPQVFELLGVDHGRVRTQGNCPAGISGTTAPGDDGETQLDAGAHESRDLLLLIGAQHY